MKKFVLAVAMGVACCSMAAVAQGMGGMQMGHDGKALPSPRKMADVDLKGTKVHDQLWCSEHAWPQDLRRFGAVQHVVAHWRKRGDQL